MEGKGGSHRRLVKQGEMETHQKEKQLGSVDVSVV